MKKDEAEKAIRYGVSQWMRAADIQYGQPEMPNFGAFVSWMKTEGYGHYFDFRSRMGPMEDAEMWFGEETGQSWRN